VQIIYERNLRPAEKQHEPWVTRVTAQMLAAFDGLEADITRRPLAACSVGMTQAGVITAVSWFFTQQMLPELVPAGAVPALAQFPQRPKRRVRSRPRSTARAPACRSIQMGTPAGHDVHCQRCGSLHFR